MSDHAFQTFSEIKNIYLNEILKENKDYGEDYENKYKKTGKKSKDYDQDGEIEDEGDEYAGVKDKAIKKASKGREKDKDDDNDECDKKVKMESFSNWREDLFEVLSKIEPKMKDIDNEEITEKKVKNKVILNPSISENFTVLDEVELDEEFITESANIAANYLYEMGLNEHGLTLVLEQLGDDKFIEYVFYISEDYVLTEARRSGRIEPVTKTGKPIGSLRGAAKKSAITSKQKEKARRDVEDSRPSTMTSALKRQSEIAKKVTTDRGDRAVKAAVKTQPKAKTTKDKIAKGILGIISGAQKQYSKGMERHRAAVKMASQTAETGAKLAKGVSKGAKAFGGGFSSGARMAVGLETPSGKETKLGRNVAAASYKGARQTARSLRDAAAKDIAKRRVRAQANENVQYILEKAVSEQQQKIFGLALSVKRGEVSRSKVSDKVLEIVDGMTEAEIRKFAATKHKGIPAKA